MLCKDGTDWQPTPGMIERWSKAYPDVNVPSELERAACWLEAYPQGRPKIMQRFCVNWLARAQRDKNPHHLLPRRAHVPHTEPDKRQRLIEAAEAKIVTKYGHMHAAKLRAMAIREVDGE